MNNENIILEDTLEEVVEVETEVETEQPEQKEFKNPLEKWNKLIYTLATVLFFSFATLPEQCFNVFIFYRKFCHKSRKQTGTTAKSHKNRKIRKNTHASQHKSRSKNLSCVVSDSTQYA